MSDDVLERMTMAILEYYEKGLDMSDPAVAEVAIATLKTGTGLPNGRRVSSEGYICQKETGAYANGRRDGERRATEEMRERAEKAAWEVFESGRFVTEGPAAVLSAIRKLE